MKIVLFPQVNGLEVPTISVKGDVLTINGESADFSVVPNGYQLPVEAVESPWFTPGTVVERIDGQLTFSLIFPVTFEDDEHVRNPQPLIIVNDGEVLLPKSTVKSTEGLNVQTEVLEDVNEN